MAYTHVWDETIPTDSTAANTIDDIFRALKLDIRERLTGLLGIADFTVDPLVIGNLSITNLTVGGTLNVTGAATLSSSLKLTNTFYINGAAATNRIIRLQTNNVDRWAIYANSTAESGSNAGSNFGISAYDDVGVLIDAFLTITRAAGGSFSLTRPVSLASTLSVTGAATFSSTVTVPGQLVINNTVASNVRSLVYRTSGSNRWNIYADNVAESGSNVGSGFNINAYDDSGAFIDTPLAIVRAAGGNINLNRPTNINNNLSITGTLSASGTIGATGTIFINGSAGNFRSTTFQTGSVARWGIGAWTTAEGGSNTGSEFIIRAYSDAGAAIDNPVTIIRAAGGSITLVRPLVLSSTLTVSGAITGSLSGNASTATALQTPRTINGVSFDGTADITVAAAAGTLTGTTLAAGVTASSLTSVGTLTALSVSGNLTLTAAASQIIPGVTSFAIRNNANSANNLIITDAGAITVRSTISGATTITATTFSGALSGNATTATTLQTARTINGVSFNGSANITVTAAANTLSGTTLASGVTASSLTSLGTLSSLSVSGIAAFNSGINLTGILTVASGIGNYISLGDQPLRSGSVALLTAVTGSPNKTLIGDSSTYLQVIPTANGSLPGTGANNNGIITIDTTNSRLCYYSGGSRYYLAGTSF